MGKPIELNIIPQLSPFTAEIKLTYDRKLHGVKFDFKNFNPDETDLIAQILKQCLDVIGNPGMAIKIMQATIEAEKRGKQ